MAGRKPKKRKVRPRSYVALQMIEHCKGGAMKDRKKHANKMKCRRPVNDE